MIDALEQIDIKLFLFLNDINGPVWDHIMYFVSGKLSWLPLYAFILFLFYKKYHKKVWIPIVFTVILITLSDQISVQAFKNVFERLRPCHNPDIKSMVHLVHNRCGGTFGFVSSHAANTFALASFVSFIFRNKYLTWSMYFWASLVSYSRIYLGRHYPGDVLGGALLGFILGWLVYISMKKLLKSI